MKKSELKDIITNAVMRIGNLDQIEMETQEESAVLEDDYGLDSLDRIELCMEIEKEAGIGIKDEFVENWGSMSINKITNQVYAIMNPDKPKVVAEGKLK